MLKIRKVVPEISNDEYDVVLSVERTGVFLSGGRGYSCHVRLRNREGVVFISFRKFRL